MLLLEHRTPSAEPSHFGVLENLHAVNEHVGDSDGQRGWILGCRFVKNGLRVEDNDVSLHSNRNSSPVLKPKTPRGQGSGFSDRLGQADDVQLADIAAKDAGEGARAPR